jgi:hypothetical protein
VSPTSRALWQRSFDYFVHHHERSLNYYHKRSNVGPTFHMIKSKFATKVLLTSPLAHVNEILS